ncbi:hypothetical protein XENORESO_001358 [Xenotaenia resolanae]|uniref:Uncharacterized protein n=1 Tax=Xenotaenia resolanae TaxID=208358 RepID=A0ABV0VU37_9TELE
MSSCSISAFLEAVETFLCTIWRVNQLTCCLFCFFQSALMQQRIRSRFWMDLQRSHHIHLKQTNSTSTSIIVNNKYAFTLVSLSPRGLLCLHPPDSVKEAGVGGSFQSENTEANLCRLREASLHTRGALRQKRKKPGSNLKKKKRGPQ